MKEYVIKRTLPNGVVDYSKPMTRKEAESRVKRNRNNSYALMLVRRSRNAENK